MIRGFIRDILILYLGYRLILVWTGEEFTFILGILVIVVVLLTIWFLLEKLGILPKIG